MTDVERYIRLGHVTPHVFPRRFDPRAVPPATLLVVASLALLVGSLIPFPAPDAGGVVLAGPFGVGADKWVHAAGYAVVAGLAAATRGPRRGLLALVAVIAVVAAVGVGVEVVQSVVPGRTTSTADAVANTVGAAVGVVCWRLFVSIRRPEAPPSRP